MLLAPSLFCPRCSRPFLRRYGNQFTGFERRRWLQTHQFQPFVPPAPESLSKPAPPRTYARTRKWGKRLSFMVAAMGSVYLADRQWFASSLTRSARTFALGALVALDYKINFRADPPLAESLEALHARNAQRLFDLLRVNGGLYLKIGQAIAMQSAVLPPEFQRMFARMFDDAPQNEWRDVERVIREDFGKSPEELFGVSFDGNPARGVMERRARASASVAQVHWARLADGREVAVKIQKREIAQQVGWDLWAFKVVTYVYSKIFDIPLYSLVPYISERLFLETDFVNEADNAERMAAFVAGEPRLRDRVYVPRVYRELSSRRVMTAEWIEGVRLWDKETLTAPWKGERRHGSPGCRGTLLDDKPRRPVVVGGNAFLKPERTAWRGRDGEGGLGVRLKDVMTIMVDLFSAQVFLWGWIHCDPHPGNIFIRRQPSGKPELVLIDHGLYVHLEPDFRQQYALFWKSLMTFDNKTLAQIARGWGANNVDIFASAALMRPYMGGDGSTTRRLRHLGGGGGEGESASENEGEDEASKQQDRRARAFEARQQMRRGLREILGDDKKWPRELIFIGRNMRIVQGNNQFLGSPVNRIKITGVWASRALVDAPELPLRQKLRNLAGHIVFRLVLLTTDVAFLVSRLRQRLGWGRGMEDDMEAQLRGFAKDTFGVQLNHGVFEG